MAALVVVDEVRRVLCKQFAVDPLGDGANAAAYPTHQEVAAAGLVDMVDHVVNARRWVGWVGEAGRREVNRKVLEQVEVEPGVNTTVAVLGRQLDCRAWRRWGTGQLESMARSQTANVVVEVPCSLSREL
eukprot:3184376-Rhodomonas_salina.1